MLPHYVEAVNMEKYYIGLDIGTNSVGYAVTTTDYNLVRKGKKDFWGVRLFEEGQTAAERRLKRASRRRLQRAKERILFLRQLFDSEITAVDPEFYQRLNESMYHTEHRTTKQPNSLFNDLNFTDKNYHKKYKSIYHLRVALMNGEINDIRLLYLGIAHILKHRGHFLFEGQNFSEIQNFETPYNTLLQHLTENYPELVFEIKDTNKLQQILQDTTKGQPKKEREILQLLTEKPNSAQKQLIKLLSGGTITIGKLLCNNLGIEEQNVYNLSDEIEKIKLVFNNDFENKLANIETELEEHVVLINLIKALYDWSVLSSLLQDSSSFSEAKIKAYNRHHKELKLLKKFVREYCPDEYKEIFNAPNVIGNYPSYIRMTKQNKKLPIIKGCTQVEFCKYLTSKFKSISKYDEKYNIIFEKLELNSLLPKLRTTDNSVIPSQLHQQELKQILNANRDIFPFLQKSDGEFTIADKILKIFSYRIPYYVGPLNTHSPYSWVVRNKEKITPWNFEKVVDSSKSAEAFIKNLTSFCTYLRDQPVLPKYSLLYSKFEVLNELNNLKLNEESISITLKQNIFDDLFKKYKTVSPTLLKNYLIEKCIADKAVKISGIDGKFNSSLKAHFDFVNIFGENYNEDMAENIIKWITIFPADPKMLIQKISENYTLTKQQIKKVCSLNYNGWGRLSKKFLTEIKVPSQLREENLSIMDALYKTNENLMKLLSDQYGFMEQLNNLTLSKEKNTITYDDILDLYCSPAVKKAIWQTIQIVKEIEKVMKGKPERLFIEVTRTDGEKTRTISRKKELLTHYKAVPEEYVHLKEILQSKLENDLRSKTLYLYFTQLGRCAYTGNVINYSNLFDRNIYDIDHIYPRSKTKDDSIRNNLVLVERTANLEKKDLFPIPNQFRQKNLWDLWYNLNLISKEKHQRLCRVTPLSKDELAGFINRQLVETGQSTKAVAQLFREYYKDTKSEVVYVKAGHVTDFRNEYELKKSRIINNFHHAQDAYLNIVVGNVFHTKFTKRFFNKIETENYSLKPEILYNMDIGKGENLAWNGKNGESITTVKKVMKSNKVLFTRQTYCATGTLFDETIYKAGEGKFAVKNTNNSKDIKHNLQDLTKYGGYDSIKGAYFCVVESTVKNNRIRSIEYVPIYLAKEIEKNPEILLNYLIQKFALVEPKIIIPKLLFNALLNIDGFPMYLSSRSLDRLVYKGAVPLVLEKEHYDYIYNLEKFANRHALNPKIVVGSNDSITIAKNLEIFEILSNKLSNTIYNIRLSSVADTVKNGKTNFENLTLEKQCLSIVNMLPLFANNTLASDLSLIGGSKNAGKILTSKKISTNKKVTLINQSITGIYENRIDLLNKK